MYIRIFSARTFLRTFWIGATWIGVFFCGVLGLAQSFDSGDWPTRAGNMQRQASREFDLVLDGGNLHLQWKRFMGERVEVEMEPVVVEETVYLGLMNGKMVAMDVDTGAVRWVFQAEDGLTDTPTACWDGSDLRLVFAAISGMVYCVNGADGGLVWEERLEGPIYSGTAVVAGLVMIGTLQAGFYGLELAEHPASGLRRRWYTDVGGPVSCTAAVGPAGTGVTGVFFTTGNNVGWALNSETGAPLWQHRLQGAYTKRTYAVYGSGSGGKPVVIFVTRKPGAEYSEALENRPFVLQNDTEPVGPKPGPTVVAEWADFYQKWPRRRPLYFLHAETGADLWEPSVDDMLYTPLYIPYWGEYMPVVDAGGTAWFPASGSGGDHALGHDERLWKMDLQTGAISQVADPLDFKPRADETGRPTLIGDRYYQTISEDVAFYDTADGSLNASVFGNGMFTHRQPMEVDAFVAGERAIVFGGWHKYFTRFGSSSPGGFGGANDAPSALVVTDDGTTQRAFFSAWGHLYALGTEQKANPTEWNMDQLDLYSGPRDPERDVAFYQAELKRRLRAIIQGHDLEPISRFWGMNPQASAVLHAGESITILANALEYVEDAPLAAELEAYLADAVTTYILSSSHTQGQAWLDYDSDGVLRSGDPGGIRIAFRQDNPNLLAMKLYALYRVAKVTEDQRGTGWALVESHWSFIRDQVYARMQSSGGGGFDVSVGFYVWPNWISHLAAGVGYDNFHPTRQIGMAHAMAAMAERVGDSETQIEAAAQLDAMLVNRVRWLTYVRSLYKSGDLSRDTYTEWQTWGYSQPKVPVTVQGYLDADSEYRVPYGLETDGTVRYALTRHGTYPYYLVGFWPLIREYLGRDRQDPAVMDLLADYTGAIERMHPWWFMGDMSHIVGIGMHEDDSMSQGLATDLFCVKAYLNQWTFEALRPYLPWEYEDQGDLDLYRVRSLTALLWAVENNGRTAKSQQSWSRLE